MVMRRKYIKKIHIWIDSFISPDFISHRWRINVNITHYETAYLFPTYHMEKQFVEELAILASMLCMTLLDKN